MIMNYAKEIQSIARKNVHCSYDVGDHKLFGFSIDSDFLGNPKYTETIVQIDIYEEDENNIAIYLLPYYWIDEERGLCDHDDLCLYDLSDDELQGLYEEFKSKFA